MVIPPSKSVHGIAVVCAGVLFTSACLAPVHTPAQESDGAGLHAHAPVAVSSPSGEGSFETLMNRAVVGMHAGMQVKRTGDPDRDFARMMIAHHQGAVDMARVELQFGHDERLRRLAQEIIVTQTQEIAVMKSAIAASPASQRRD